MSPSEQVLAVFEDALDVPPEQRSDFLDARCGHDSDVRRRVESLLAHESAAGDQFMSPPSAESEFRPLLHDKLPDPLIGHRVGGFTLRAVIAQGGMGKVYLAEQSNPRRDVAMKIMHRTAFTASAERRFDVESRILAYLRHPNIAQVYEAGTHEPQAGALVRYFAMEYVPDARRLIQYAEERSLCLTDRLGLFLQLCDAVHHGHQKGVIHRDLKPANILVDSEGRLKVIDFGIARATDSDIAATTMHTEAGHLLGTLAYMSPEQCAADPSRIDTATDIYSLGMILFELLTGRMPYDVSNMTIQSAARVICENAPARPSEYNRRLRGDAETIILKAIEKDPVRRYATVNDLANDIRQFLRGEPISARPSTAYFRLLRWAARHPTKATAVSCISVVALIALASAAVFYVLGKRPDHIEQAKDKSEVRLLTVSGYVLHRWVAGAAAPIEFAKLVQQPKEFGGKRLAVIAFPGGSETNAGKLCAFDIDRDWSRPVWQNGLAPDDLSDEVVKMGPKCWDFSPRHGLAEDIFPESQSPGLELAIIYVHRQSHCVLCVYNTNGILLYRVWQDGGIGALHWLAKSNLLICAGAEEDLKEKLGKYGLSLGRILFALRPQMELKSREYVRKSPGTDPLSPVWYKNILPPQSVDLHLIPSLSSDAGLHDHDQHFRLDTEVWVRSIGQSWDMAGGISMIINDRGQMLPDSRSTSDEYNANRDRLPKPNAFRLSDAPPEPEDIWAPSIISRTHP